MRVAITNGVGTYNVTQVGLSGGNCIPVIYSMSDGIFWSEVSVAIQNDLVVVGFSSGQSGWPKSIYFPSNDQFTVTGIDHIISHCAVLGSYLTRLTPLL